MSVISVTYQSRLLVEAALASALRAAAGSGVDAELIVVDNASADGTAEVVAERFPDARLIRNDDNRGFGSANNQAFAIARGRRWLLLNPDATLEASAIAELVRVLDDDPGVGAAAPSIEPPAGGRGESAGMLPGIRSLLGHLLFLNRLLPDDRGGPWRGFLVQPIPGEATRPVEWASAAVLMLRPEAVRAVGGFDERIFLYGEDIELCERLGRAGWRIVLVPRARAHHLVAGTQGRVSTRWVDALDRLYARSAAPLAVAAFDAILGFGLTARAAAGVMRGRDVEARTHTRRMHASALRAYALMARAVVRPFLDGDDGSRV